MSIAIHPDPVLPVSIHSMGLPGAGAAMDRGSARQTRQVRGRRSYLAGMAAEDAVARAYLRRGCTLLGRRVRCGGGELDLVFRRGDMLVFVEVKSSKTHARAIESLSRAQLGRITAAADVFVGQRPDLAFCDRRVDLAAVDAQGRMRVVANITL